MSKLHKIIQSLFLLTILSCAGSKSNKEITLKETFNSGIEHLEKGKYLQAQSDFKNVLMRGTGSDLGDDAQYYLGESYYRNEEYLLAVAEYEKLTRRMSFSPFVEDARFKICEAYRIESPKYYHDQEYSEKSLDRYQEFLDDFPNSKFNEDVLASIKILRAKLGKKFFETGVLYIKMEEYESAKISFQTVLDSYYDTDIILDARKGMIIALAKNKEINDALSLLNTHKKALKNAGLYSDAEKIIDKVKKQLAKENN